MKKCWIFVNKQLYLNRILLVLLTAVILILLAACGGEEETVVKTAVPDFQASEPEATESTPVESDPTAVPTEVIAEEATEPPPPTPTIEPTPAGPISGEYIYSNGNIVRDVALFEGSLWAASTGGLVRYDLNSGEGRKYTTLDGLPNIGTFSVEACMVNGTDRLLVGSRDGLVVYDAASDGWESGSVVGFAAEESIHEMACDNENGRLILQHDDIAVIDLATQTTTYFTEDDDGLAWLSAEQIVLLGDDIWWPTDFSGLSRIGLDGSVETWNEENGTLPDDKVSDIALGADGAYWLGASSGLIQWQDGAFTLFDKDNAPDVIDFFGPTHVETAVDNTLWLGFTSNFCQFDPATSSCVLRFDLQDDLGFPEEASLGRLQSLPDGRLLLHSFNEGIAYYDGVAWTRYALENQAPHNFYDGIVEASDGTIWTYGEATYRTNLEASSWDKLPDISTDDLVEASDGTIWMVSGRRVAQFNGTQLLILKEEDGLLGTSYNAITVDDNGVLYVGGNDGYSIIDGETITAVGADQGWDMQAIRDLLVVDGVTYAATVKGLAVLDGGSWTVLVDETYINLPDDNIGALGKLSDGTILLGTTRGLAMVNDGEVTAVSEVTGSISDIFVTEDGQIHVVSFSSGGTQGGYFHFDGNGWNGRSHSDFPMSSLRAVMVDTVGTIWIGMGDTGLGGGILRIVP
ncbi:MAG: hypothetical protein GY805_29925 [Chloroflexi bacterium]|nr:hypothetical protein [Chloroflexota bacterium]